MKSRITLIAIVVLTGLAGWLLLRPTAAATTEVKLYISPSSVSTQQGKTFTEKIRLSKVGNEKVDYVSANIKFPANLVEVTGASRSGSAFNDSPGLRIVYNNSTGTLSATGSGNTLGNPADVLVVIVTFRAKAAGKASLQFASNSQAGALLGNGDVKNALDKMVGSVANIASLPVTETPTSPTSPPPTSPQPPSETPDKPVAVVTKPKADSNSTTPVEEPTTDKDSVEVPNDQTEPTNDSENTPQATGIYDQWWFKWAAFGVLSAVTIGGITWAVLANKKRSGPVGGILELENEDTPLDETPQIPVVPAEQPETPDEPIPETPAIGEPTEQNTFETATTTPAALPEQQTAPRVVVEAPAPQPTIAPPVINAAPAVAAAPIAPPVSVPAAPVPQVQNVPAPAPSQTTAVGNTDDDIPDMFEEGKKRLERENLRGLDTNQPSGKSGS